MNIESPSIHIDNTYLENLPQKLHSLMKEAEIPGLAMGIMSNDEIIFQTTIGFTNLETQQPINNETLFGLQSTTKTITAIMCLLAHQNGILDIDQPITKYCPNFVARSKYGKDEYQKITLRHLLSHTSGLVREAPLGGVFNNTNCTWEEHIESIFHSWLRFSVGEIFNYSGIGMDLAVYVCEKASGKLYFELINELLEKPLGIRVIYIRDEVEKTGNFVTGYYSDFAASPTDNVGLGCGVAYMNLTDLIRLNQFMLNNGRVNENQILQEKYVTEMRTQISEYKEGLGTQFIKISNIEYPNHPGGGFGYTSQFFWHPELKLGVVAVSNNEDAITPIQNICREILQVFVSAENVVGTSQNDEIDQTSLQHDNLELSQVTGFYCHPWGTALITESDGEFYLNYGTENARIKQVEGYKFKTEDNLEIRFNLNESRYPVNMIRIFSHLGPLKYLFLSKQGVSNGDQKSRWMDKIGIYVYPLYDSDLLYEMINIENGSLVYYSDHRRVLLETEDPDRFELPDGGMVIFDNDHMININGTRVKKDDEIVSKLVKLAESNPQHRHLTPWMLGMLKNLLTTLGRSNEVKEIDKILNSK